MSVATTLLQVFPKSARLQLLKSSQAPKVKALSIVEEETGLRGLRLEECVL